MPGRCIQGASSAAVIGLLILLSACGDGLPALNLPSLPVATVERTQVRTSESLPAAGQRFRVEARGRGTVDALKDVSIAVRSATVLQDGLRLRLAFENTSDRFFLVTANIPRERITLQDEKGNSYPARQMDGGLASIAPAAGFVPGGANVGDVEFARPTGSGPYLLELPNFAAVSFRLDSRFPDSPSIRVPDGSYALDLALHSADKALSPIDLRVESVGVQSTTVSFDIAFVNTNRQGYRLLNGPAGEDARLLDAERNQLRPEQVGESLAKSIAPADGWDPGGGNSGTLTFGRPDDLSELRLVFPGYSTALLRFGPEGLLDARAVSADGGPAAPTATPDAEAVLYAQVSDLLNRQSAALVAGDEAAYLSTFTSGARKQQQAILKRAGEIPFETYVLELDPDETLPVGQEELLQVKLFVRYTLRGIPASNSFLQGVRADFVREQGSWLVKELVAEEDPPFWWTGDVVAQESEHFLVFTRPAVARQLDGLIAKNEAAYSALAARGLPLEPRYVAFFTASQKDFSYYTSRAELLSGIALWRFEFKGDNIVVESRAFYINGDAYGRGQVSSSDLQVTITHELAHLVLSPYTRPFTPAWLSEGASVYFSGEEMENNWQHLVKSGHVANLHLDTLTEASRLGDSGAAEEQLADQYAYSGAAFTYLVDEYGQEQALAFYRSYTDVPVSQMRTRVRYYLPDSDVGALFQDLRVQFTQDAVQQYFGSSLAGLDLAVQDWIKTQ